MGAHIEHRGCNEVEEKFCSKCTEWKFLAKFGKDVTKKDGLQSSCKECIGKLYRERIGGPVRDPKNSHKIDNGIEVKLCSACEEWFPLSEFRVNNSTPDKLFYRCKKCAYEYTKIHFNIPDKRTEHKVESGVEVKQCSKCKRWFPLDKYRKSSTWDRLSVWCTSCNKENYQEHKKERSDYKKVYIVRNKEKIAKSWQDYYEKNGDTLRAKSTTRNKKLYHTVQKFDKMFILHRNISSGVWAALKKNKGCKEGANVETLLTYSFLALKAHLEYQFEEWMTWENYGAGWHIDHIAPISSFFFTSPEDEEFKKCWSLENLRPLKASENIDKRDTVLTGQELINALILAQKAKAHALSLFPSTTSI